MPRIKQSNLSDLNDVKIIQAQFDDLGLPFLPNFDVDGNYESGGGISETVPGRGLTVQDLFKRSQTVGSVSQFGEPVYSDRNIPMFEDMDFADRAEFLHLVRERRKEIDDLYKVQDAAEKEAAAAAAAAEAAEADRVLQDKIRKGVQNAG